MTKLKRRAYDNWPIANMGLRFLAQIIDQSIVLTGTAMALAFIYPQKMATTEWWLLLFFIWPLISLSTHCFFIFFTSTTPGKKAFGLKIVNAKPNTRLSPWQVLSRQCLWWLGALSLGVGWTTILTRQDRRAWHDLVSETFVAADNKKSLNSPVTLWQKTLGHSWAVTVSLVFFSFLSAVILFEFQKFNQRSVEAENSKFLINQELLPTLEETTWLLFTDQFEKTPVKFKNLEEENLSEQIKLFVQARKIPRVERFDFYKNKMQKNEDYLCRQSQSNSPTCFSAQALATILSGIESKTARLDGVFPALKVLYKIEREDIFQIKTQILQAELSQVAPNSTAYVALKTYLIRIHSQKGEFEKAAAYVGTSFLPPTQNPVTDLLTTKYYEYSCQAAGFKKCDVSGLEFCTENKFWVEWSEGCGKSQFSDAESNAAKLGFTWMQFSKSKMSDADWTTQKQLFTGLDSAGPELETQIYNALDFALSLKSSEPVNLIEKSKALSLQNPLWGWAQTQAFREFGAQWLALINKPEQNQATLYAIGGKTLKSDRMVASLKKSGKSKAKHKRKKTDKSRD